MMWPCGAAPSRARGAHSVAQCAGVAAKPLPPGTHQRRMGGAGRLTCVRTRLSLGRPSRPAGPQRLGRPRGNPTRPLPAAAEAAARASGMGAM